MHTTWTLLNDLSVKTVSTTQHGPFNHATTVKLHSLNQRVMLNQLFTSNLIVLPLYANFGNVSSYKFYLLDKIYLLIASQGIVTYPLRKRSVLLEYHKIYISVIQDIILMSLRTMFSHFIFNIGFLSYRCIYHTFFITWRFQVK